MKKKIRRTAFLLMSLWVAFGLLLYVVAYFTGNVGGSVYVKDAQITNFAVCYGPDPNTGEPIPPKDGYVSGEAKIYACGHLDTKYPLHLQFHLHDEGFPATGSVYSSSSKVRFSTGDFYDELKLDEPLTPGKYRLIATVGRTDMASLEFEVREQGP